MRYEIKLIQTSVYLSLRDNEVNDSEGGNRPRPSRRWKLLCQFLHVHFNTIRICKIWSARAKKHYFLIRLVDCLQIHGELRQFGTVDYIINFRLIWIQIYRNWSGVAKAVAKSLLPQFCGPQCIVNCKARGKWWRLKCCSLECGNMIR